ncbi:MAG: hypothetical protein AAF810_01460 [Cyanobacteria bacterium P01_D01_bin.36]
MIEMIITTYFLGATHTSALLLGAYFIDGTGFNTWYELIGFWLAASLFWPITLISIVVSQAVKL